MSFSLKLFSKTLVYKGSFSVAQLQANFKQIAAQDKQAEKKGKIYIAIAIVSSVAAFLAFIWAIETSVVMLLPVLLVAVAIVTGGLGAYWSRLNVPNLRHQLPTKLIDMLSRDMAKGALFNARIDFSSSTHKSKQTTKEPWPAKPRWTQAFFADPWLRLSGQFLDHTQFELTLTEIAVVRSGWQRSRSGKHKHKTKTKPKGAEVKLLLKFPRKKYGAVTILRQADLESAVNLPTAVALKKIKVNDHQLLLQAKVPPHGLNENGFYTLFTQMLLSAYQVLNLSKALSKASG